MLVQDKQVAIIGGGPGGLTLARLLQLKGVAVKVYERDYNETARVQGATLDLHYGSGLKAIKAAGLMDVFKTTYRPGADKGRVVDEHANIIYEDGNDTADEDIDQEWARPEIDRGPLRNMLLDSLLPGTMTWDSHLATISQTSNQWKLEFKNGTAAIADIVVGADGANSKIRPFVTNAKNAYAGTIILQGNVENSAAAVPEIHQLLNGGKIYAFADEQFLHVSSKGDGSLDFYISMKKDEDWLKTSGIDFKDRLQVLAWAKEELSGWGNTWLQLFENVSLPLLARPQYCMPLNQHWDAQSNITLLGDAAHIMPPSGEGVNLAMLDALELSECLTNDAFTDTQAAIASYEQQMQPRAIEEAKVAMEMTAWMHTEGAADKLIQLFNQNQ